MFHRSSFSIRAKIKFKKRAVFLIKAKTQSLDPFGSAELLTSSCAEGGGDPAYLWRAGVQGAPPGGYSGGHARGMSGGIH